MCSVAKKRFIVKKMPVKIEMCNFRAEKRLKNRKNCKMVTLMVEKVMRWCYN